jgi:hypothetical protein
MPGSFNRVGNLKQVFENGTSPFLNRLARLSVLYEDFRLELCTLDSEYKRIKREGHPRRGFGASYFLRRSAATLVEFQSGLMQVTATPEFKALRRNDKRKRMVAIIEDANRHLQKNAERIKDLRNCFGGHVQQDAVDFATRSFASHETGTAIWVSPDSKRAGLLSLELHYAENIVAGAIGSMAQGGSDVPTELKAAIATIMDSYPKIQGAMFALFHVFLWPKFGR